MKKTDLDKRICDVEKGAENTQTYREFINACCDDFFEARYDLDNMSEEKLNELLDFVDELCWK